MNHDRGTDRGADGYSNSRPVRFANTQRVDRALSERVDRALSDAGINRDDYADRLVRDLRATLLRHTGGGVARSGLHRPWTFAAAARGRARRTAAQAVTVMM